MSSFATAVVSSSNPRTSRAQFSPSGSRAGSAGDGRADHRRVDDGRAHRRERFAAGLWTPGLLERLHEPLTRYHE